MPARARNLFNSITGFGALREAALRAARGKRAKPGVAAFLANMEREILRLERELRSRRYRPGRYTVIEIFDPKHRKVSAAPFRDRVVHHAFCAVAEPIFERGFIYDTYASRKGKGTASAMAQIPKSPSTSTSPATTSSPPSSGGAVSPSATSQASSSPTSISMASTTSARRCCGPGATFATWTISPSFTTTPTDSRIGDGASSGIWRAGVFACTRTRRMSRPRASPPPFLASSCCPAVGGACPKRTCVGFGTGCGAFGTAGAKEPSPKRKSSGACARGSPMRSTRKPGACAKPSSGRGGSTLSGSLATPLPTCVARRLLEQQTEEPPFREPQQELGRKPEQQQRVPRRPHALPPEPVASRGHRARSRAFRGGHDERGNRVPPAPRTRGRGAGCGLAESCRSMARAVGMTHSFVNTVRRSAGLKPHLWRTFRVSTDPRLGVVRMHPFHRRVRLQRRRVHPHGPAPQQPRLPQQLQHPAEHRSRWVNIDPTAQNRTTSDSFISSHRPGDTESDVVATESVRHRSSIRRAEALRPRDAEPRAAAIYARGAVA